MKKTNVMILNWDEIIQLLKDSLKGVEGLECVNVLRNDDDFEFYVKVSDDKAKSTRESLNQTARQIFERLKIDKKLFDEYLYDFKGEMNTVMVSNVEHLADFFESSLEIRPTEAHCSEDSVYLLYKEKIKVVVSIKGGCIGDIHVSDENADVILYDYDNIEEDVSDIAHEYIKQELNKDTGITYSEKVKEIDLDIERQYKEHIKGLFGATWWDVPSIKCN